jgi:hypothetical protein
MAKKMMSRDEMLARTRKKLQERSKGRRDPDEFRCPLAKNDETLRYYFKVLPPVEVGDVIKGGKKAEKNVDWYYQNGSHFFNRTRYECPRIHDEESCPMCEFGFDMMNDSTDKDFKRRVSQKYLARSYYAVNIYFLQTKKNPEAVRGRVFWYNAPRTIYDLWENCIQSDDAGDPDEPKACGLFFHPWESTYTFKLEAVKKGDWNTYEKSEFLPATFGPLVSLSDEKDKPDDEAIERILNERHYLPGKFAARDADKIQELLETINSKDGEDTINIKTKKSAADTENEPLDEELKPAPKAKAKKKAEVIEEDAKDEVIEEDAKEDAKEDAEEVVEEVVEEKKEKPAKKPEPEEDDEDEELKGLLQSLDDDDD